MLQYLAIIEKKTNEILQMHHFSQNKGEGNKTGQEDKKRGNEESNLSGTTQFPEKDLLSELQAATEKAEKQELKDFEDYANKVIQKFIYSPETNFSNSL